MPAWQIEPLSAKIKEPDAQMHYNREWLKGASLVSIVAGILTLMGIVLFMLWRLG